MNVAGNYNCNCNYMHTITARHTGCGKSQTIWAFRSSAPEGKLFSVLDDNANYADYSIDGPAGRRDNLAPVRYVRFDIRPKQPDIIITGKYNPTAEATSYPSGLPKRLRLDNI